MKNPTPRQIAFYSSFAISAILLLLLVIINFVRQQNIDWVIVFILFIVVFVVAFLVLNYALEIFIYRKIKVIYKNIANLKKSQKGSTKIDLNRDIINDVNDEVVDWANDKNEEITHLKELEKFRRDFLGNVSHELKTPIFTIQGYIETLIDGGLEDQEINLHYLKKASKSIERLNTIVEDLQTISSFEAGRLIVEPRTFDITDLAKEVLEMLEMNAKEKSIKLGIKEGCDKSMFVFADKDRIRQVLINLVVNSIKYGNRRGSTTVGLYDMDEIILVEVSDTGIGIPEEHLPRLFERFYRVDKSRSREEGGTGLGLAIVKHIIEAHNQTINVRSTVGVGTTFGFTIQKASGRKGKSLFPVL